VVWSSKRAILSDVCAANRGSRQNVGSIDGVLLYKNAIRTSQARTLLPRPGILGSDKGLPSHGDAAEPSFGCEC
jgi:hypothetical protein